MPFATEPLLADPEDLQTIVGDEPVSPRDILLAIRRAGARFRGETQNPIHLVTDDVITLDGDGTAKLLLPAAPVIGDIAVKVYDVDVPAAQIRVSRHNGIIRRVNGCWPRDYGNVEITYSHGYADIPGDVQDAVLEHAVTLALTYAHVQQETAGGTQAGYGKEAMVGTTQKWANTVARYTLQGRA